jgi:V/A-type H+-transporting ATPase subunit K
MVLPFLFVIGSAIFAVKRIRRGASVAKVMSVQIGSVVLVSLMCFFGAFLSAHASQMQVSEGAESSVSTSGEGANPNASSFGMVMIAAALAIGIPSIGAGIAVASAAPAAIAAVSEDSKIIGHAMTFAVFGEALALYGLVISIMIISKFNMLLG